MSTRTFSDIFVLCAPGPGGELSPAVEYALSWHAAGAAHVTFQLIGHKFDPPYSLAPAFVASLAGPANAEEKARLDKAEQALRARLPLDGGSFTLDAAQLDLEDALSVATRQARLHHLTIIDEPESYIAWGRTLVEEVLFHSGRPVVVVPKAATSFRAARILVAWDGTAKAARALNDALPLLRQAGRVEIVSVSGEKDIGHLPRGVDCAVHLARDGVKAEVVGLDAAGRDAGAVIRERAALAGIDMIVMGAFAHPRWRQLVFGGVTDSMLSKTTIPVFLSA
jgi:nucleotide-binding universal stress UspA family protein